MIYFNKIKICFPPIIMVLGRGLWWKQHCAKFFFLSTKYRIPFQLWPTQTDVRYMNWQLTKETCNDFVYTSSVFPFFLQPVWNAQAFLSTNYFKHNSNFHLCNSWLCSAVGSPFGSDTLGLRTEALSMSIVYQGWHMNVHTRTARVQW
jgi:hypothetical protein